MGWESSIFASKHGLMKRILTTVLCVLSAASLCAHPTLERPDKASAVFRTDTSALMLTFCGKGIIRVEYSFDGTFSKEAPTPAVVNPVVEPCSIEVNEAASLYEIFTGDLRVSIDKDPLRVRISDKYQKLITSDEGHFRDDDGIRCVRTMARDEQFFGLGEKADLMNRRGGVYTMWNSDKPCYCIDEDPLYKSIPFFLSSKRYGIFFDNSWKSVFDFTGRKTCSFGAEGGEMIYYVITGEDYKDILKKYIMLTGKPVMPPRWALGFSQCRGSYVREDLALEVAQNFRQMRSPCDIIYQDIGWVAGLQDFEWNPRRYDNPRSMLEQLHEMGFHVIVSQDPVISQRNARQWAEADSLSLFAKDSRTGKSYDMPWPWGGNCGAVDFTDPAAAPWWGAYQQKAIDDGVDGFWTDMGEPAWSNEEDADRLNMVHAAGPHAKIHNVYGLYWDRVVTEQFEARNPGRRLFQMTRSAFSGMQRYTFSWTGDSGSEKKMTDSWEQFEYQIPMMLSAGLGGIPFITGDITGYCGDIDDYEAAAELYIRWMQFGLFTPLSRAHHEGNTAVEPWMFGAEAVDAARKAIELKYSLLPYIYTLAREAYDTGIPLMRAMFLEFPTDKECRSVDTQFMFGESLLVAPVTEPGAKVRSVYLPKGRWCDYYTGQTFQGGRYVDVPVTLDRIPLFVKSGSIVPSMPVQQYTGENPDADIYLDVWPEEGKTASFTLYEDDGESLDYKKGIYTERTFSCRMDGGLVLEAGERVDHGGYSLHPRRNIVFRIRCARRPGRVTLNGRKVRPRWDRKSGTATVIMPE